MSTGEKSNVKLGYAEYVLYPDNGQRHEILDGDHFMNPAPSTNHQTVSKRLQYQLYSRVELAGLGLVFSAPTDVQLADHDIVQPDLVVLTNSSSAKVTSSRIVGPPELVIEILSPATADIDLGLKRRIYERAGVAEYWIIDPFEQSVTVLVGRDSGYVEIDHGTEIWLSCLPGVHVDMRDVWQNE